MATAARPLRRVDGSFAAICAGSAKWDRGQGGPARCEDVRVMSTDSKPLRVALLGCGVVGSQVVRLIHEQAADLTARVGAPVELVGVAVRRPELQRDADVPAELLTSDAHGLVTRDDVDVVVEVIGGIEPARSLILAAFAAGKPVGTANKALPASDGATVHDAAARAGVDLYFEASVAGGIPLLRPLKESLAGERISRVLGI